MRALVQRLKDPVVLAAVAVGVGALARLVWVIEVHPPDEHLFSDMKSYVEKAQRIVEGGGLQPNDTFRPPGTHLLLAAIFLPFGTGDGGLRAATGVWWAMSSVTPVLVGLFVRELAGRRAAVIATVVCALWPLYISYVGYFLGETPGTFFIALAMFLLLRGARADGAVRYWSWAGGGAAAGATFAIRPQLTVVFVVLAAFGLLGVRRNWRGVLVAALTGAVMLSGIVVHNSIAWGRLSGLSGNSGDIFFHGQCHAREVFVFRNDGFFIHTKSSVETQHDRGRNYVFRTRERDLQRFLFHRGLDCIRDHGFGHVRYWGENVLDALAATTPYPQSVASDWTRDWARIVNSAYSWALCGLLLYALVEVVRRRRRRRPARVLGFLLVAASMWIPLSMVFFGAPRYRLPFDIFAFALLAILVAARSPSADAATGQRPPQPPRAGDAGPAT